MVAPLRVGVIGADPRGFGVRAHIPAVQAVEGLELAAICTAHDETARRAAARYGVPKWFGGVEGLLSDSEIDMVTIAVRPRFHLELAAAALRAEKKVYCEWPLARTSTEALEMASIAAATGVPNAVGLQGTSSPALRVVADLVGQGRIGRPLTFEASLLQARFAVASDRSWLSDQSEASGALFVASAHVIDAVQFVLGEISSLAAVERVSAPSGIFEDTGEPFRWGASDTVMLIAELAASVSGIISVSNVTYPPQGFSFRITGEEGQVLARAPRYFQFSPITVSLGGISGGLEELIVDYGSVAPSLGEDHPGKNVARSLNSFAQSIRIGARFQPDFEDGVALHRVLDAIARSSRLRTWERPQ